MLTNVIQNELSTGTHPQAYYYNSLLPVVISLCLSALVFGECLNAWQLFTGSVTYLFVLIFFVGNKKSLRTNNFDYLCVVNNNISASFFLMVFVWLMFIAQFSGISFIKYFFYVIGVFAALECISNAYSAIKIFKKTPLLFAKLFELNNLMCVEINTVKNNAICINNDCTAVIDIFEIDTTVVDDGLRYISTSKISGNLVELNKFVFEVEHFKILLKQLKKQTRTVIFFKFSKTKFFAIYLKLKIADKDYEFCWR